MAKFRAACLSAALAFGFTVPAANAATLVDCGAGSGLACFSSGNDHEDAVEANILAATGVNVDLTLYAKSDDASAIKFNFTGLGTKDGTWSVVDPSIKIAYVTVKAGPGYAIYDVGGKTFDSWTTAGILNPGGQQPKLSHLSFWTAPVSDVPEPATWLTMIAGFGMIGVALRQRKSVSAAA